MLHIDGAIVVEGKYDKAKLKNIVDCPVIVTDGFGIYKNKDTVKLIRFYAENGGIIILTDSDSAGFRIRGYIKGIVPGGLVKNAFIPDIYGKEKRKAAPSAEGKLGVEGVPDEVIISALTKCAAESLLKSEKSGKREPEISRMDLFEDGFIGKADSSERRKKLLKRFSLPERLSTNALTEALNRAVGYDEYRRAADEIMNGE